MLHSLLDRRQSGHDTYVYRSFEETTREILRLRLSTTRTCSRLKVTVIRLFFPLPVSIQFENAPVPRRRRNVSIDSTGSIRSSWRAKDRKLSHSPACFSRRTFSITCDRFEQTIPRNVYTRVAYYL